MAKRKEKIDVPIYRLTRPQRAWLNEALMLLKEGKRIDSKDIYAKLNGKLPKDFHPKAMHHRLISANGEQIGLLGMIAIKKNYKFLTICNKVVSTIGGMLLENPKSESINTEDIAAKAGVPLFETRLAIRLVSDYGRFLTGGSSAEDGFTYKTIRVSGDEQVFYQYRSFTKIQALIIASLDREARDKKWFEQGSSAHIDIEEIQLPHKWFVSPSRIEELKIINNSKFDFQKLIRLCEEINSNFFHSNFLSVAMIGRTILHHVPPVFNLSTIEEVASNYGGKGEHRSFKKSMSNLLNSLKNIADHHLHGQIRDKEVLPTEIQVDFRQDMDFLLAEIIRISK